MNSGRVTFATSTSAQGIYLDQSNYPVTTTGATLIDGAINVERRSQPRSPKKGVNVESAVYSYIQAVRALGVTKLSSSHIAAALSLSPIEVTEAIGKLHSKGVKIV